MEDNENTLSSSQEIISLLEIVEEKICYEKLREQTSNETNPFQIRETTDLDVDFLINIQNKIKIVYENNNNKKKEIEEVKSQLELEQQERLKFELLSANLLWKCSKIAETVDVCIEYENLSEFIKIIINNLILFYYSQIDPTDDHAISLESNSNKLKFLVFSFGFFSNLLSHKQGREKIIYSSEGVELIETTLLYCIDITMIPLQNVLFKFLHNVTMNRIGVSLILNNENGLWNIFKAMQLESIDLKNAGLKIICNIMPGIRSENIFLKFNELMVNYDDVIQRLKVLSNIDENSISRIERSFAKLKVKYNEIETEV